MPLLADGLITIYYYIIGASSSKKRITDFTYDDLLKFLRNNGNLMPLTVKSKKLLLDIFIKNYESEHWKSNYKEQIKNENERKWKESK